MVKRSKLNSKLWMQQLGLGSSITTLGGIINVWPVGAKIFIIHWTKTDPQFPKWLIAEAIANKSPNEYIPDQNTKLYHRIAHQGSTPSHTVLDENIFTSTTKYSPSVPRVCLHPVPNVARYIYKANILQTSWCKLNLLMHIYSLKATLRQPGT